MTFDTVCLCHEGLLYYCCVPGQTVRTWYRQQYHVRVMIGRDASTGALSHARPVERSLRE